MNYNKKQILILLLIALLLFFFLLFVFGMLSAETLWIALILSGVFAFLVLPKLQK